MRRLRDTLSVWLLLSGATLWSGQVLAQGPGRAAARGVLEKFDDVRKIGPREFRHIADKDLSALGEILPTLTFNQSTIWPDAAHMPGGVQPKELLESAMDPGLGVRSLHRQGITGRNVRVAIIDQPMYLDHPEYRGKIAAYRDMGCDLNSSMHGPAVASLLAGNRIGTAPGVRIHYAAVPSWKQDASFYVEALRWIVEENRKLPTGDKIRVVSVSAAPSSHLFRNGEVWNQARAAAEQEGLLVLDCSDDGVIGSCYWPGADKDTPEKCQPGFPGWPAPDMRMNAGRVMAPASPRTTAEEHREGDFSYQYTGRGGLSWSIPYAAGVLALGWQERPDLGPKEMLALLRDSAVHQVISPAAFLKAVAAARKATGGHGIN